MIGDLSLLSGRAKARGEAAIPVRQVGFEHRVAG
jgi:hypothetical protein